MQQLAYKATLNNFAINIYPNNYTDKFKFFLKRQLKMAKQETKITSIYKLL